MGSGVFLLSLGLCLCDANLFAIQANLQTAKVDTKWTAAQKSTTAQICTNGYKWRGVETMLSLLKERSLEGASASTCHDQPRG